jgi:hypothetical protein
MLLPRSNSASGVRDLDFVACMLWDEQVLELKCLGSSAGLGCLIIVTGLDSETARLEVPMVWWGRR